MENSDFKHILSLPDNQIIFDRTDTSLAAIEEHVFTAKDLKTAIALMEQDEPTMRALAAHKYPLVQARKNSSNQADPEESWFELRVAVDVVMCRLYGPKAARQYNGIMLRNLAINILFSRI